MKRWGIIFGLFFAAMTVQAGGIREDIEFTGEKTRVSYAFGMTVGGDLKQAGLEIDYPAFLEGLKAAMESGQTLMDRDDALEIVQNAFENAMSRQAEELRITEELFLAENAARADITVTESGLQYQVITAGKGPRPLASDTVLVHYEGALTNGTIFDSSYERGEPEEIPLEMVIPGWAEGLQLMNVGGKYRIYIPSSLAYAERGAGQIIPSYSTLVFTIDLLEIVADAKDAFEESDETEVDLLEVPGDPDSED